MKKAIVLASTAVLLAGTGAAAFAGTADGQGAQKRGLFPTAGSTTSDCNASAQNSPASTTGFAILNAPGQVGSVQKIVGEVSLKAGTSGTPYVVNLAQDTGSGATCTPVATLTANGQGNGNAHIDVPLVDPLAGRYFVVLTQNGEEVFASAPVALK